MVTDEHEWKANDAGMVVDAVFESSKVEDCPELEQFQRIEVVRGGWSVECRSSLH